MVCSSRNPDKLDPSQNFDTLNFNGLYPEGRLGPGQITFITSLTHTMNVRQPELEQEEEPEPEPEHITAIHSWL